MKEIDSRQRRIDNLFKKVTVILKGDSYDIELIAEFTKYLCVLVSGHLEKSIYMCLLAYSSNHGSIEVRNYIDSNLKNFTNARTGKIESLLEQFNREWKSNLVEMRDYEEIKGSVNSLITVRHAIAHGNTIDLSMVSLTKYYDDTKKLIRKIFEITT
ncbi:hypothetical protein B4O97_17900 [Marispirochaeta aestuarii]|uniref:RiboL-PSP-HEPN domain-containing protein n=1 Tax=Marispirochaeta aestuarii TaxID=1963862 RepID=A0A1Y1RTA1_9SPIO|nr:HEPN domain-containing protein [Marispirochaeta aestuarii]ORC30660.1 hypothetical protein B4O97_17900 [Marispirochaeta aestuarii]